MKSSTTCGALTGPPDEKRWPELKGRSLTIREYMDAGFAWLDRSLDRARLGMESRETLDDAIASAEFRRVIERSRTGEPWHVIREQCLRGRRGEP